MQPTDCQICETMPISKTTTMNVRNVCSVDCLIALFLWEIRDKLYKVV